MNGTSLINYGFSSAIKRAMIDSFASQHQSSRYGGYVPRDSAYAKLQSDGASVPTDGLKLSGTISLLSGTGAVYVLGRTL
jgi:hypothetical protein